MTTSNDPFADTPYLQMPIAARLAAARAQAAAGLSEGKSGRDLSEALTATVESILNGVLLPRLHEAGMGPDSGLAVLCTGGFGRREFAPFSDLDLIFLCAEEPDDRVEKLARSILMPLWDARLDAGHAVRSIHEALELPKTDLTAATALLDARFVAGDRTMADRFLAKYGGRVAGASPDILVARLREEQGKRHQRFGGTIFLLEPDLKSGPGGIRDMCAGRWAALARFGTGAPPILRDLGEMSARQAAAFESARDWFLKVRIALHLAAGRKQDQLKFQYQETIAPQLYRHESKAPGDWRTAVTPAVEALMHDFQRHARAIRRETTRLMQRAAMNPNQVPVVCPVLDTNGTIDPTFVITDGELDFRDPGLVEQKPSEALRLFDVAIAHNLSVGLRACDLVADLSALRPLALRADPDSSRRFLELLVDERDRATPSRLEQMNDLGLLAAVMPEWEGMVGRVQHDLYHVYTVDQHSVYAVDLTKALARGDHARKHPAPTDEAQKVERKEVLYLATLLHDIGKPEGGSHAQKGAVIAGTIARRLGLGAADAERVQFLVRNHLVMAHTSQRRDLEDPTLIGRFAELVGDEEGLRALYVITFTDLCSIGPGTLTEWKNDLLWQLWKRADTFLRRGPDLLHAERASVLRRRKREAARLLGVSAGADEFLGLFAGLPDRYFAETSPAQIARHLTVMREREGACALACTPDKKGSTAELVVVADDVPGLLAKVAGVFFANRIDIITAAIYSREATKGESTGVALDIFRVRPTQLGGTIDETKVAAIRRDLNAVVLGQTAVETMVATRKPSTSLLDGGRPSVPDTEVRIDNSVSRDFTVIDVITEDRPGILYTIAHTLAEQGLDIHRSKVGVEADRVADVFYVRDKGTNRKVRDDGRFDVIIKALADALPTRRGES